MAAQFDFHHYLPVTDEAMEWGMYVTGAGRTRISPGQAYPPTKHPSLYQFEWGRGRTLPEFQVILVTDGRGSFESRPTGEVKIEHACLMFLFPGVWHRYRPPRDAGWTERWLSFNGDIIFRLVKQGLLRPEAAVQSVKRPAKLARAFDRYLNRIHAHPTRNTVLLSLHATSLLAEALDSPAEGHQPREPLSISEEVDDSLVAKALDLIWTHSHQPLPVTQIARLLEVNRRTVERRFVEVRGHTILTEINDCRLSRAKRLLVETDLPIKHICHLAGFTGEERMRVTFVECEGMPPTAYRTQHRRGKG